MKCILKQMFRTDRHNNPIAFTTDIAKQAGLKEGLEYSRGDLFNIGVTAYHTARLLLDPIELCIRVIDKIGFYTKGGSERWIYIGIPEFIWKHLSRPDKVRIIEFMYKHEGGTDLISLFKV